jgi:TetR/AcrR family transcriptional regulator, transcriptional repressor for nem operon
MKVSREEAVANRERIVDVAGRLFRENGLDGIGVADLMKGAGMTHGGFYGHFDSKEQLAEEACSRAMARSCEKWTSIVESAGDASFDILAKSYLSEERLNSPGSGCAFAALGADAGRQRPALRRVFKDGFNAAIAILGRTVSGSTKTKRRETSIAAFSQMVGAMVLARSVGEPALAAEILQAAAADLTSRSRSKWKAVAARLGDRKERKMG